MLAVAVKMLTGLVSVKVVAVIIGPAGVALLGQLSNFSTMLMTASTGGITNGVTKYIAEYKNDRNIIAAFLKTSLKIVFIFSCLSGILLIAGASFWSSTIFHTKEYSFVFVLFGVTITLYALNSLLLAIINGFKEFRKYVTVNISGSIVGLIFSVVLVLFWKIEGALVAAVTSQSVVCIITICLIYKSSWFDKKLFLGKIDKKTVGKLLHYSLMAIVTATTVPVSQLIIRSFIINDLSLNDAGLWEGINRISNMYLMVITTSLGIYYLPKLSESKTQASLRHEIFKVYKLFIPILLFISLSIFIFRDFIVEILFSSEFYGMKDLFMFQIIGDFFKISSWLLAYLMIAKSQTKLFVSTEIIFPLFSVLLSIPFIDIFGIRGATIVYAVKYFIYLVTMVIIYRKIIFNK
jgi:PST family polysaccharide transporter